MFTDTHCHVVKEFYDDIDKIVENAKKKGINRLIVAADDYKSSLEVIDMVDRFDNVYGCVGIHPENCLEEFDYSIFDRIPKKIVAIGEIGLDYYWTKDTKEKQIEVFRKQLEIAERLNLPVVVHSREATEDTINILKEYNVKGVIHSFSGSLETARIYLKMGFKLGINGVVTFKNCKLKEVYKELSPRDVVLETDSPFLTPEPYRGQTNEPAHVIEVATFIANVFEISLEELSNITNQNIAEIFYI